MTSRSMALQALMDVFDDVAEEIKSQPDYDRSYVAARLVEVLRSAGAKAKLRMVDEPRVDDREDLEVPLVIPAVDTIFPVRFDWTQLRLVTQMKANEDGRPLAHIGKEIGFVNIDGFLAGSRKTLTVDNVLRIMLWLGVTDWRDFAVTV